MTAKRPSYVSIRARQRNVIEGLGTLGSTKEAAKRLGVTRAELKRFRDTKPKKLRQIFNRSPVIRRLYTLGARPETRKALGLKRIRRYSYLEFLERSIRDVKTVPLRYENSVQIGRMVQRLYYENNIDAQRWSAYTYDNNIPNSINTIKFLYKRGVITPRRYAQILHTWKNLYRQLGQERFDQYYDELADLYEDKEWFESEEEA